MYKYCYSNKGAINAKGLLDSVFVIILDITKTSSNNCLIYLIYISKSPL